MNILIACEESQTACLEFRKLGHNAFSCDIQPCSGGSPEFHILGDCLRVLNGCCVFYTENGDKHIIDSQWDLIIAHPPCTHLAKSGSCNLFTGAHRFDDLYNAVNFFNLIYNADCQRICIENPVPMARCQLPKWSQVIQPYEFGDNYTKQTCLWLKGLPPLIPQCYAKYRGSGCPSFVAQKKGSVQRSKSFVGIARAMAIQWG